MTAGCLSLWLRFGRRLLIQILRNDERSSPSMPTDDEIAGFVSAISTKYPALINCWGPIDGLKLRLQRSGNNKIQNLFFNGWTHNHQVCNLFLFSPDGKIRACYINACRTMHNSTMASWSGIFKKLDDLYETTGAKVVVDSAFASERRQLVYKSYQSNIESQGPVQQNLQMQRQAASVWQMAEWDMRGLQASFPRLKDRLDYKEKGERRLIIELIVYSYNYQASLVGLSQIQSVYMPWLQRSANTFVHLD
jgi:hypothetical protein